MAYALAALVLVVFIVVAARVSRRYTAAERKGRWQEDTQRSLISPQGLQNLIGIRDTDPSKLPGSSDDCGVINASKEEIDYLCGHRGAETYQLNMWGLESKKFKQKEYCPACWLERLQRHSIRCVLCGLPIFSGQAVALYHEASEGLRRDIGTKVGDSFLGCLRWDCCPSGGFFGGHWTEEGFRPAFEDGLTGAELAYKTGKPVVGNM